MDYRKRNYYLVRIDTKDFNEKIEGHQLIVPSLKISEPYGHFKGYEKKYDGEYTNKIGNGYWEMLYSCKKEHSEKLERILNELVNKDDQMNCFMKLDQFVCGQ